jgi:hypothetical protein
MAAHASSHDNSIGTSESSYPIARSLLVAGITGAVVTGSSPPRA